MRPALSMARAVAVASAALALSLIVAVAFGSAEIGPGTAMRAVFDRSGEAAGLVWSFRLPRVAAAALVGANLATAGALTQTVLRNPLADPSVLGISAGASLAAIALVLIGDRLALPGGLLFQGLPAAACLGGILAATAIYRLAWSAGATPRRLVLCGIGIASILQLVVAGLLAGWGQGRIETLLVWVAGSLYAVGWPEVGALAALTLAGLAATALVLRPTALLALGDHPAASLGIPVEATRVRAIGIAVVLASATTAYVGPVAFVGLVVPHMARRLLARADPGDIILLSPVLGAILAVVADGVGRTMFVPYEMPVGILSAAIGAPLFLTQLRRAA